MVAVLLRAGSLAAYAFRRAAGNIAADQSSGGAVVAGLDVAGRERTLDLAAVVADEAAGSEPRDVGSADVAGRERVPDRPLIGSCEPSDLRRMAAKLVVGRARGRR